MDQQFFSCRTCNKTDLLLGQMKKEPYLMAKNRGICKPCISEYNKINMLLKKAERNPDDMMSCNSCDRVFSKYKVGTPNTKQGYKKKLNIDCPFCGSEEVDAY